MRRNSNVCILGLRIPELSKFDQLPRTLGALQDMQILWIGKIQLFWSEYPGFQSCAVNTANAFRIRVCFEDVLLKLLKEQGIVVVILKK